MATGNEIDPPIDESRPIDNDALDVNEVAKDDEVESNDSEGDVAGRSNEDDDVDSEDSEERNESADSDDNLLMSNYEEVPIERKHLALFNIKDKDLTLAWE